MANLNRIEPWKTEVVQRYLHDTLPDVTVEHTLRGPAVLFVVHGRRDNQSRREVLHQLWVGRTFFDRFVDPGSLRSALRGADVAQSMRRSRDRVVQLQ
jgi:hypothetical protein